MPLEVVQYDTVLQCRSRDHGGMNVNDDNPQINERLWQQWLHKNHELDKAGARNRLRFLKVVLVMVFAVAALQNLMK
jgi:hypothetical protein